MVPMLWATSDLFPAYELEGGEQLAGVPVPLANREPGETGRGRQGGLAHTAAHEFIHTLGNENNIPKYNLDM